MARLSQREMIAQIVAETVSAVLAAQAPTASASQAAGPTASAAPAESNAKVLLGTHKRATCGHVVHRDRTAPKCKRCTWRR